MRIWLTGATGFVGSAMRRVLGERHGHDLLVDRVELTSVDAVRKAADAFAPDAIVHCAILADFGRLERHPQLAWRSHVGATATLADAADRHAARLVLISTDWVFDGVTGGYGEADAPGPINPYGYLKAASELAALAVRRGTVARLAGVQGVHWARPNAALEQGIGFASIALGVVDALRRGERYRVWDGPGINRVASPILSTHAADLVHRVLVTDTGGILHVVGAEAVDRVELAQRTARAFGLDESLLDVAPPPAPAARLRVPENTSLRCDETARVLGTRLPDLDGLLAGLRAELPDAGTP